jgi:hypothetical protein
VSELVSDERVEKALTYLAETDLPAAEAKARAKALEAYGKTVKAFGLLEANGTVAEREAKALISEKYAEFLDDYERAVIEDAHFANKRATESGIVEVWRSCQANRRKGNV